jgi:putative tricarboxylic transport membrane protein
MDLFANLSLGFSTALSLSSLLHCFMGVLLGTLIGVLPGLGPLAAIAMLLPMTFALPPVESFIMLAGIYYGAQYGGSTTAILVNLPGESSSVMTAVEGYQMAKKGRAGSALAIAAIGSFFAGTVATLVIAMSAPLLARVALKFASPENFSLMVLGLIASVVLAVGSPLKALGMVVLGLLLGLAGTDVMSGSSRFTMGIPEMSDGINFVVVAMGIFGLGEVIRNLEQTQSGTVKIAKVGSLWPTPEELRRSSMPILRGTALGSFLGLLPGGGALLAAFASYAIEKKVSRRPGEFGHGAIEGVAGPESANNAGAQTSFIPMLTLGIPSNPIMGLMIGAMIIQGIQPGPAVMTEQPALFWGLIASMWVGNVFLIILNLPLIGIWIYFLKVPYAYLFPAILVFCSIGVFTLSNAQFDVYTMALFGALGYVFLKLGCEPAPLLLGFILGPLMEENLRRAMQISGGDAFVFFQRPISASILVLSLAMLASVLLPAVRRTREVAFQED